MLLKDALDNYCEIIKIERANYIACYTSFLEYCDIYFKSCTLEELSKILDLTDIQNACKYYFESSKKASSLECIQRFLTAIDCFCKFTREENDITWNKLEYKCRNKQMVKDICISLGSELKKKIYLPFDNKKEIAIVEEEIELLNKNNFYQFGQGIIYKLLITYGFKENIIINLKKEDFDADNGTLHITNNENSICIEIEKEILKDLMIYCELNKYTDRTFLFTKNNGLKLTADSMLATLTENVKKKKVANFTPTTIALKGVANLINKELTPGEIKILTDFKIQKIEDVSRYLLIDKNIEEIINKKLSFE